MFGIRPVQAISASWSVAVIGTYRGGVPLHRIRIGSVSREREQARGRKAMQTLRGDSIWSWGYLKAAMCADSSDALSRTSRD